MSMSIFVGNLPFSATAEEVEALFSAHGEVEDVRIATDRRSGRPRGHCTVRMSDEVDAYNAITALDGTELGGRALKVSPKLPRSQRPTRG
ncbi:MAG: RNA-binding protein [Alphaproteobacteria bacterium]|nr:RNA-binding protein [Alphaproteobacteria bacterium]